MQFAGPYRNVYTPRTDGVYFRCEYAGQTFGRGFAPDLDSARVRARSLCLSHRYKIAARACQSSQG